MVDNHCFNWNELRENTIIYLEENYLSQILFLCKKKAGSIHKLALSLGLSFPSFYDLEKKKIKGITVKKLIILLDFLNVDYNTINSKILEIRRGGVPSIVNPHFPFDLNNEDGVYLIGCLVSDGTIYKDVYSRGVLRLKYSSSDKESIQKFIVALSSVFGKVHVQFEKNRNNVYLKVGNSAIPNTFVKAGVPYGNKTKQSFFVPWLVRDNINLWPAYFSAVFGDEGSSAGGSKYNPYINLTRYHSLDNIFDLHSKFNIIDVIVRHGKSNFFPTGHRNITLSKGKMKVLFQEKIFDKICNEGKSPLLWSEMTMLQKYGLECVLWLRGVSLTNNGSISYSRIIKP